MKRVEAPIPTFASVPALSGGSALRVIAPSGPFDRDDFDEGVERLARRYDVRVSEGIHRRQGFLAGDDSHRLASLWAALEEPDTEAILCARGGYGATRLLDRLPPSRIRRSEKLLVGFSDVTALHAAWARAGLRSIHGPMVAALGRGDDALVSRFIASLEGYLPEPIEVETLADGVAEGSLLGGNLAVLAALVGTPHLPPLRGTVLFLEDVGERPYRIDRMLTQLRQARVLESVAAIALGRFTACEPGPDGVTAEEVLSHHLSGLGVPVVAGLPSGHVDDNLELPLGAPVRVDASAGVLHFLQAAVHRHRASP